jgi:hypothetical protein
VSGCPQALARRIGFVGARRYAGNRGPEATGGDGAELTGIAAVTRRQGA